MSPDRTNITFILGTRPEVIKCWPLIETLRCSDRLDVTLLLTGQHREITRQAMNLFDLEPDIDLDVMTHAQDLNALTSRLMGRIGPALDQLGTDRVIVQGDTSSVLTGALSAFHAGIPVWHLEAGLRTTSIAHPFPEEANRRLVSVLADLHLCPTEAARDALLSERVDPNNIHVTGNTGIDALRRISENLSPFPIDDGLAHALDRARPRIIAVTVHRRENRERMDAIARTLHDICHDHPDTSIIFPMHPGPAVRSAMTPVLSDCPGCHLIEPLDYANIVRLLLASDFVLTDSGGLQEEAPFLGRPVLVMRTTTERPEAVHAGAARLLGDDPDRIATAVHELLTDAGTYERMARPIAPYGDGYASERIRDILESRTFNATSPALAGSIGRSTPG